MDLPATAAPYNGDVTFQKVAREIAMDMLPLEEILALHNLTPEDWDKMQKSVTFQGYLASSIEEWNSASNTSERVKLKSLAFVEESLPEFYARAHDPQEGLSAKVEVLKTVARFAGVGGAVDGAVSGDRLSVTINLGADKMVKFEKDISPRSYEVLEGDSL